MIKHAAVVLAAITMACVPAKAQTKNPQPVGVYDSTGTFVGTYLSQYPEMLVRKYPSGVYGINFKESGFVTNASFLFPAANCQGTGYLSEEYTDYPPQPAYFDGINLWITTGANRSVGFLSSSYDGKCSNIYPGRVWYGAPAAILDSTNHGFHPPFSIPGN